MVQLAVGQAGVVVDDADDLDLPGVARAMRLGAIAVRPVEGVRASVCEAEATVVMSVGESVCEVDLEAS